MMTKAQMAAFLEAGAELVAQRAARDHVANLEARGAYNVAREDDWFTLEHMTAVAAQPCKLGDSLQLIGPGCYAARAGRGAE